jgi:glucose/arabinose dehydrogenase
MLAGLFAALAVAAWVACSGGGGATSPGGGATPTPGSGATATPSGGATPTMPPPADPALVMPSGFSGVVVGNVSGARELATLPNGDLLVGTNGRTIYLLPNADAPTSGGTPQPFITLSEGPANGVTYGGGAIFAATNTTIWKIPYTTGDRSETNAVAIAHVRTGPVAPNSDGDVHTTTSVAISGSTLYAGVGSSCNACIEVDPTRASVQRMNLDGSGMTRLAENSRNPIALAVNPATGSLWIGGAGQDNLTYGHPYEYLDSPTLRGSSNVNYGWPACEENHQLYNPLGQNPAPDCSQTVAPAIEFNAYSTLIGATFYPATQAGAYAFPAAYRGGLFVTSHGSWHCCPSTPPRVYFVPMNGDAPATAVNWSDPTVQHSQFVYGFGTTANGNYIERPAGIAVGSAGSLFFASDESGDIVRIRHN